MVCLSLITAFNQSNYSYNEHMNPIEKHKSQIEKKISMLEQKFRDTRNDYRVESREVPRRHREFAGDENKVYAHQIPLSKTMEVKGRPRGVPGQITRLKKNYVNDDSRSYANEVLAELKELPRNAQVRQGKEEKIKQLQFMVKSLLEGQKVLEKELNDLKAKSTKDQINKSKLIDQTTQLYQSPFSAVPSNNDKPASNTDLNKQPPGRKRGSSIIANHSFVAGQAVSKEKRARKTSVAQSKRKDFQQLYQELKERSRGDRRVLVEEEWKSRLWSEVESRVRESDKQYKDTIHHNKKHEFDHLMSTYELQRKLKDDLISKVYQQCNDQIYK